MISFQLCMPRHLKILQIAYFVYFDMCNVLTYLLSTNFAIGTLKFPVEALWQY